MIHILDSHVIDQISAGEVIERPAQMVKELIENAIDAQATEIEIDFSDGGKFVQVVDNGIGISSEDLPLAFARHATSKITQADDLWDLNSYGFRGEALASLGAVARTTLISKTKNDKSAFEQQSDYGKIKPLREASRELGTTIRVEGLFSNTPARLKFLKSDSAEHLQIKKVVKAMALVNEKISFRVRQQGKILFYWPAEENWLNRVKQVLDQQDLYEIKYNFHDLQLEAVLSSPKVTTRTAQNIWLFVQERWVQDRSLQAALMDGYRSFLMHGEYPYAVLRINAPKDSVDVNIHPTKSQIKFINPSDAYRLVLKSSRDFMEKAPWITELQERSSKNLVGLPDEPKRAKDSSALKELPNYAPRFQGSEFFKNQYQTKQFSLHDLKTAYNTAPLSIQDAEKIEVDNVGFSNSEKSLPVASSNEGFWQSLHIIGQAQLTYIVAQNNSGLILIDQHAAHERVAYERLMSQWKNKTIEVQNYLLPESIEMDEAEVEAVVSVASNLEQLGLFVDRAGPSTLAVRAAPVQIRGEAIHKVLHKTAEDVMVKTNSFALESVVRDLCATMACHSVVRAGQSLSTEQMKSLMIQMDEFSSSSFCPHGRPVYVEYPFSKIERDFGRIV
ncbi:MAG: DNA mismatch repair endonuclease MutL [Bdellovibrionales bacterium]|nr:DNA mismatch repair endonuclease MutL [Bdellovibrionales bacterium]